MYSPWYRVCGITGCTGLTLEEALLSEEIAMISVAAFPDTVDSLYKQFF